MTIGPEPRMRILWMSSLRGTADLLQESVEEVQRVVWPGARLRVVLHRAARDVEEREPFDGAVVEVDVAELGGAEVRLPAHRLVRLDAAFAAGADDGEPVVLRRDLDVLRLQVLHRVVGPAVAERQLERLQADGAAEQLVPEAD